MTRSGLKHDWLAAAAGAALVAACSGDAAMTGANAAPANGAAAPQASAATAAAPPAPLPPEIARWGQAQRRACTEAGGRATGAPRVHASADFNGDGRPDYFVGAHESFSCPGHDIVYLTGPVATPMWDFFLSTPRGYTLIEGAASDIEPIAITQYRGRPVAMVNCGGPGAYERPCETYAFGWDGREMTQVAFFIGGRQVNEDGTRLGGGGWVRSGFPEIPQGFYAEYCYEAMREAEGVESYLYLTPRAWREWDGASAITRIERNGPVRYRFHLAIEDEAGNVTPSVVNIMVVNAAGFRVMREGNEAEDRILSHCAPNEVPARLRREWAR